MYQTVDCSHLKKIKKSQFTCLDAATIHMEEIEYNQSSCLENEALNLYGRCLCVSDSMVERGRKRSYEKSRQIIIIILGMSFRIFFNYTGAMRFSILVSLIPMYYIFFFLLELQRYCEAFNPRLIQGCLQKKRSKKRKRKAFLGRTFLEMNWTLLK